MLFYFLVYKNSLRSYSRLLCYCNYMHMISYDITSDFDTMPKTGWKATRLYKKTTKCISINWLLLISPKITNRKKDLKRSMTSYWYDDVIKPSLSDCNQSLVIEIFEDAKVTKLTLYRFAVGIKWRIHLNYYSEKYS